MRNTPDAETTQGRTKPTGPVVYTVWTGADVLPVWAPYVTGPLLSAMLVWLGWQDVSEGHALIGVLGIAAGIVAATWIIIGLAMGCHR